jgi:hypothetical protein
MHLSEHIHPGVCVHQIKERKAPDIPAGLPSSLTAVLRRCFTFDPGARPSATELVRALGDVFADGMKVGG